MPDIRLSGKLFTYDVNRRSLKSLRLRLISPNSFTVSCPRLTPKFIISLFINDHSAWIIKNAQKIPSPSNIKKLANLTILDRKYDIIYHHTIRDSVIIFSDSCQIHLNSHLATPSHLRQLLNHRLRPLALKLIKSHLDILSRRYGFKYSRVTVRNQSTRFGSCSSAGNLSFNWQIILLPSTIFTHILLHELTHLKVKNHSRNFWQTLSLYDPEYLLHRRWLKTQASKHLIFSR